MGMAVEDAIQCKENRGSRLLLYKSKTIPSQALLGNVLIKNKSHHGIQLDCELNFQSHIKEAMGRQEGVLGQKGICLSMFLVVCSTKSTNCILGQI